MSLPSSMAKRAIDQGTRLAAQTLKVSNMQIGCFRTTLALVSGLILLLALLAGRP